jgi:hypothetical protein
MGRLTALPLNENLEVDVSVLQMDVIPRAQREIQPGSWEEPDFALLSEGLPPAPAINLDWLGSWGPWVSDYAAMKSAPVGYAVGCVLVAAAAAIGAARMIEARTGWREFPALWILLVGAPSALKTPVLTPIVRLLGDIEREEAKHDANGGNEDDPHAHRLVVNDVTVEAMATVLTANPRGLILVRDEIAGFIGNMAKYGGDGNAAFWLERFQGGPFSTDRVGGGHKRGDRGLVSMLGGIQPERLEEMLLGRTDDGFVSRLLMIFPEPVERLWDTPSVEMHVFKKALFRLRSLSFDEQSDEQDPVVLRLDPDAIALFKPWWEENAEAARSSSGFRAGLLGKGAGIVLRLALILELMEWALSSKPEPRLVSGENMANALYLFEDYFVPSTCRAVAGGARDPQERAGSLLLKEIRRRRAKTVNAKEIYREWGLPSLTTATAVSSALETLRDLGWVSRLHENKVGRPRGTWQVNPRLFERPQ